MYVMTVNADDVTLIFRPSNISFFCTRIFLMMERRLGNPGCTGVRFRTLDEFHPSV